MKLEENGINKVGYSSLAGVLSLAYVSNTDAERDSLRHLLGTDPLTGGLHFVLAFLVVFLLIAILEMIHAINVAARESKVDHGLR